jgi:hypothetical protein
MSIGRTGGAPLTSLVPPDPRFDAAAHRGRTLFVDDHRPHSTDIENVRVGGVRVTLSREPLPGPDLVREAAEQVSAAAAYRANRSSLTPVQVAVEVLNEVGRSRRSEKP